MTSWPALPLLHPSLSRSPPTRVPVGTLGPRAADVPAGGEAAASVSVQQWEEPQEVTGALLVPPLTMSLLCCFFLRDYGSKRKSGKSPVSCLR